MAFISRYPRFTHWQRLGRLNLWIIALLTVIASIGFLMLYSAANGNLHPWASKQILRFMVGLVIMVGVSLVDMRTWLTVAYPFYAIALLLLIGVEVMGLVGMGAQRWIDLYVINLQPSEIMKIALILTLARYFHVLDPKEICKLRTLLTPIVLIVLPILLVMRQPDLGTALIIVLSSCAIFWVAGVRRWKFIAAGSFILGAIPFLWPFLREYQKKRIFVFLNPESDPLNSGYHILQSKIALGSGGLFGKGFLQGSQSHLSFLPEKQTDFIFTMLCEEFGFLGGLLVLTLYTILLVYGFGVALNSRSQFSRLVVIGVTTTLFLYVFINVAMVMGLLPAKGLPLPLISYGGTAMLTVLFGQGLIFSAALYRDVRIGH